jgi:hypothetical protein
VLTREGTSRSAAIRQAVLDAANRRERAARMRREVLRMEHAAALTKIAVEIHDETERLAGIAA